MIATIAAILLMLGATNEPLDGGREITYRADPFLVDVWLASDGGHDSLNVLLVGP